ncbi:MAG: hypothetical protein GX593_05775 [Actinomycetales bacterium]|nr:hypothetical protein [Actinomycetales bacterium]
MGFFENTAGQGSASDKGGAVPDDGALAAIGAFWDWWAAEGEAQASLLFSGNGTPELFESFGEVLGERVKAIGDLAVATGPGRTAKHCLVLTAGGDPDLRPVAAAWLAAAPASGEEFEYADHRQAHPDPVSLSLRFEGGELDLVSTTVLAEVEGPQVHVQLSHPKFAELPENDRVQVAFLFLDAVLGERAVEESIGQVDVVPQHAVGTDPQPLINLPAVVASAAG